MKDFQSLIAVWRCFTMGNMRRRLTVLPLLLFAIVMLAADSFAQGRRTLAQPLIIKFDAPRVTPKATTSATAPAPPTKPAIDCQMVVNVDGSKIDPKMRVSPPETGAKPALRVVKVPSCPAK
jgi:hypothetical protein